MGEGEEGSGCGLEGKMSSCGQRRRGREGGEGGEGGIEYWRMRPKTNVQFRSTE